MGLFSKKQADQADVSVANLDLEAEAAATTDTVIDINPSGDQTAKDEKETAPPISFFTLFRFASRLEVFLNVLALVAAAGAGTAQPFLALLFGNLAQTFVAFGTAVEQQLADPTSQSLQQAVKDAAKNFRHSIDIDSLFLFLVGKKILLSDINYDEHTA
jgi:ATP-binding cassette, subfamily B (MDR/TAP), member 1